MPDMRVTFWNTQRLSAVSHPDKMKVYEELRNQLRKKSKDMLFFCEVLDRPSKYIGDGEVQKLVHSGRKKYALSYMAFTQGVDGRTENIKLHPVCISSEYKEEGLHGGRYLLRSIEKDERSFQTLTLRAPGYAGHRELGRGDFLHIFVFHANSNSADAYHALYPMIRELNRSTEVDGRDYWMIIGDLNIEADVFNGMVSTMAEKIKVKGEVVSECKCRSIVTGINTHYGITQRLVYRADHEREIEENIMKLYYAFIDVRGNFNILSKPDDVVEDIIKAGRGESKKRRTERVIDSGYGKNDTPDSIRYRSEYILYNNFTKEVLTNMVAATIKFGGNPAYGFVSAMNELIKPVQNQFDVLESISGRKLDWAMTNLPDSYKIHAKALPDYGKYFASDHLPIRVDIAW